MKATAVIKKVGGVSGTVGSAPSVSASLTKVGGASVIVDPALDPTSANPVENKAITEAIEEINDNLTSLATEVDGKQNKLYYVVNGERYPVLRLVKTSAQGVSGILLEYDDGTVTGDEVFFADGNGLITVLNAVNASIATKADASAIPTATSQLTNDSGFVDTSGAAAASPVQSVNGQTGAVSLTIPTVPSKVSAFTNDAGYLTLADLPIYNGGVQ